MIDDDDDPRVLTVAREYLAELEAGRTPVRAGYETRFPELRAEVAECLDGVELAHAAGIAFRPHPPAPPAPDLSPEPLGDFRIVREIGRGGMGVVYEAVQLSLGRLVALKVLPFAAGLDAKHLQRFKTEAHAAAQLHHTNIVPVYAVGQDRGTHYYAMQLIDGRPLDAVIRELRDDKPPTAGESTVDLVGYRSTEASKPTPHTATVATSRRDRSAFATAARFAAQVADALDYAHEAGVVHRDIKPANLLLDARGTVWVTDFGLAQVQAEANVTRTGDVFGTLRYSSPEQATGRRTDVDHRTDVYSLGATLYELLTLQPIFPDTDRQSLLYRIIHEEPVPPRAHDKNIPPELETIVLKAVAKLPVERYASAGEFAADLRRFLDDRPILARRPTPLDHTRKWLRRHPAYTHAGLLVLLLTAIGFGISTAVVSGAKRQTEDALSVVAGEKQRADDALAVVAKAKQDADNALAREKLRTAEAEERFRIARQLADEHIRVANEDLGNDPVQEGLRQRMLQTALEYYREFIELRKDDPTAVEDLKAVRDQVSGILSDLAVMAGAGRLELLRRPDVQEELKLAKTVVGEVVRVLNANNLDFGRLGKMSPEQMNARVLDHAKRLDADIRPLLTDAQSRRLDQVFLQSRGLKAFDRPEVAVALKLTTDDREKLRQIQIKWMFQPGGFGGGFGGVFGGGRGPGGGGRGKPDGDDGPRGGRGGPPEGEPHKPGNAMVTEMVAALKPDQQAAWKQLVGEPFNFRPQSAGWPGGPGGPGVGGPGGGGPGGVRPGGGRQ